MFISISSQITTAILRMSHNDLKTNVCVRKSKRWYGASSRKNGLLLRERGGGGVTPRPFPPLCVIQMPGNQWVSSEQEVARPWHLSSLPGYMCALLEDRVRVSIAVNLSLTDGEAKHRRTSYRMLIMLLLDMNTLSLCSDEKEPQEKWFLSFLLYFLTCILPSFLPPSEWMRSVLNEKIITMHETAR